MVIGGRWSGGWIVAALVGVAVAAAACGSGSSSAAARSTASSPSTATSSATGSARAGGSAGRVQAADAIDLQLSDFPSGWTTLATPPSSSAAQTGDTVSQCSGVPANSVSWFSPSPVFTEQPTAAVAQSSSGVEAGSEVGVATTASTAARVVTYTGSSAGAACVQAVIEKALRAAGSGLTLRFGPVSVTASTEEVAGASVAELAVHYTYTATEAGATVTDQISQTIDVFSKGATVVELWAIGLPPSSGVVSQLLTGRVQRA